MKTSDVLKRVAVRIGDPDRWCQGNAAEDADGNSVLPTDERAVRWCMTGAVSAEAPSVAISNIAYLVLACEVGRLTLDSPGRGAVTSFNDRASHQEVVDVVMSAMRKRQAGGD